MKVKCKLCKHPDGKFCTAKKSGGKHPSVKLNANRVCDKFFPDPFKLAKEAEKEYERGKLPLYVPTWRYYATKDELEELNAENGPKYVRVNPNV